MLRASRLNPEARATGPTAPSSVAISGVSTPTPSRRAWTEGEKLTSRHTRAASSCSSRSSPRAPSQAGAGSSSRLPPTPTESKRKRWPVSDLLSLIARSFRAAKAMFPAAKPTPAQIAAMSLRWL